MRRSKWIFVVFFALVAVFPVLAQQAYSDPSGRFTIQPPAGWTDASTPDYGLFTSDNGISVYALAVEAADVQQGIAAAIKVVDPSFDASPVQSSEISLQSGTWTQNVYVFPDGSLQVAIGQAKAGFTYLLYIQLPDQAALQAKQNDLNTFLLSFTVGKPIDLSNEQPAALDEAMRKQIDAYIKQSLQSYGIVGASVAIVQDGKTVFSQGYGTLDVSGKTPVDSQTLFMIGSVTKSMTTLMTATLVDDGVLTWDAPATDILPDFALSDDAATPKIRVRDLFNMTSGLPRYDTPLMLQSFTPPQVQSEIAGIHMLSRPGQAYHYSNFMVALGGYAGAVAAGSSLEDAASTYADLMQKRVFDPIGMSDTTLDLDAALADANHAMPTTYDPIARRSVPLPVDFERFASSIAPAGAVWSNADDMGKYMITQMNGGVAPDGQRIVSEKNLLETWKPEIDMGGGQSYGMGWTTSDYHGQRLIQHGGATGGFSADFAFLPDSHLGVVVLINHVLAGNFGAAVREYTFETAFGLEHASAEFYAGSEKNLDAALQQLIDATNYRTTPITPEAVTDYVGNYERGVRLHLTGDKFYATTTFGDIRLLATNERNVFVGGDGVSAGTILTFKRDTDGTIALTIDSLYKAIMDGSPPLTLKRLS